ncbi:MAG: class II fumarate hydratase [Clostridia bacterium]|nr:class II fumarate hydratase [Clostridia bacterium]
MDYRIEKDSMGEIKVPKDKYWGAQTQRSLENFKIGNEKMPYFLIYTLGYLKLACARANRLLKPEKMTEEKLNIITMVVTEGFCENGLLKDNFPLSVWQTGSGTQTNMNVNEVIANFGNEIAKKRLLHPNDDVNMSQSSNDAFPTAMHITCVIEMNLLCKRLKELSDSFKRLEGKYKGIIKTGRTHLQDATPISFSQEISGFTSTLKKDIELLEVAKKPLLELAIGGTAVGTGLNAPKGFDEAVCNELKLIFEESFKPAKNKFHALSSKDEIAFAHGAIKAVACDLMKIANDIRWLSSGPRCGLSEITIPENEPGSSIMPGKVNPTQCESLTMVCAQVMGNDTTIGICASQGNFQLNVYMPVIIYNFVNSTGLLCDAICSFEKNCVRGIKPKKEKMKENLDKSLMTVTALTPHIGYEKGAEVAKLAFKENISLKEACLKLGYLTSEEFDKYYRFEEMI